MDYSLLSGIGSCLTGSYLTNPYVTGLYSGNSYLTLGNGYLTSAGAADAFQSGVRFGQALEKAMAKNPDSAAQLQDILEETFKGQTKSVSTGGAVQSTAKSSTAYAYGSAAANAERPYGQLGDYLAGRRETRIQQRLAERQLEGRKLS